MLHSAELEDRGGFGKWNVALNSVHRRYLSIASPVAVLILGLVLVVSGQEKKQPAAASKSDYERFALLREGNASRGRSLFFDEQKLACIRCHSIDGKGGKVGPDLFAIGDKFGRREIITAVLSPSDSIAVGYSTTTVTTKDGEEHAGVIKQVTDRWLELMSADSKLVRINTADISKQTTAEISLMPEGLQNGLTREEFTDLIEFLVTLKQPENTVVEHNGMPSSIAEISKPVALRPFHNEAMKFNNPVWFGQIPGQSNEFLVLEHMAGRIWRFVKGADADQKTLFLNLGTNITSGGTRGLLGLAFHPHFRENRKYYLTLHIHESGQTYAMTVEREASPDFQHDSGAAAKTILKIKATTNNHYGGCLQFGPDGYLYVGMGDAGPQEDPQGHGQNLMLMLGKVMRIDVDHSVNGQNYRIPEDNPYVGKPDALPEIWASGLREPWRFSFDSTTGDLWAGDVGQDRYEEVDILRAGENYGWNVYEGFERFSNRYRKEGDRYTPPIFAYNRKYGPSVTGGFVYRGNPQSPFYGVYIFGDYQTRRIWGLVQEHGTLNKIRQIALCPQSVVSFGIDLQRELYVVGYEGTIYKMDLSQGAFE